MAPTARTAVVANASAIAEINNEGIAEHDPWRDVVIVERRLSMNLD